MNVLEKFPDSSSTSVDLAGLLASHLIKNINNFHLSRGLISYLDYLTTSHLRLLSVSSFKLKIAKTEMNDGCFLANRKNDN